MKKIVFLVMLFTIICFTAESALPKLNNSATKARVNNSNTTDTTGSIGDDVVNNDSSGTANSPTSITANASQTAETNLATLPNGKAYVGVSTYLSVRDEPFGTVLARLYNNEEVMITNRNGDWYEIESDKGSGWIYGKCVFASPNSNPSTAASDTADISNASNESTSNASYSYTVFNNPGEYKSTTSKASSSTTQKSKTQKTTTAKKTTTTKKSSSSGSLQSRIVQTAKEIVKKYSKKGSFPYAPGLKGGVLGCAQVATTVLKKAGAIKKTSNGCKQTISILKQAGWKSVKVPPYKAGDVIFWTQTDKKKSKGPTHVGIIMESGNNVQAMSNSSSQKRPRYHKANYAKRYCVMRKV